jgi:hypothetical protein
MAGELRGREPLILAILAVALLACIAAGYRNPVNYETARPFLDASKRFVDHDTRYLVLSDAPDQVLLDADHQLRPGEVREPARDLRVIPVGDASDVELLRRYVAQYNLRMLDLMRRNADKQPSMRPMPLSRPAFALIEFIALLPVVLNLYLRYRLGPYRLDGKLWTASFGDVSLRYVRPSTYADEALPLLYLLWIDMVLIVPWALYIVFKFADAPIR